jgi:type IV secretory pathway component VirB8
MQVDSQIEKQIQSYINGSKNWYQQSYLQLKVDSRKILISLLLLLCIINFNIDMLNINTTIVSMPFPIYVEDHADEVHNIKNLFSSKQDIEEVVARYMIARYVNLRENYDPQMLEDQNWTALLNNINGLSSYQVFNTYLKYILPSHNPHSPILQYRFNANVSAYINNIEMTHFSLTRPIAAKVDLTTKECSSDYISCQSKHWIVELKFDMCDIKNAFIHRRSPHDYFHFKVSSYQKYMQ